jgi:hypothetical protein
MTLIRDYRHFHGAVMITGPVGASGAGWTQTLDTLQCCHCGGHWIVQPGSGIERGWCRKCMAPLCGKKPCMARCAPWEKQCEEIEAKAKLNAMRGG